MALSERIECDICGIVKGEANHWITYGRYPALNFKPWRDDYIDRGHLCGESCAGKMLSKAIEEWGRGNGEA